MPSTPSATTDFDGLLILLSLLLLLLLLVLLAAGEGRLNAASASAGSSSESITYFARVEESAKCNEKSDNFLRGHGSGKPASCCLAITTKFNHKGNN